MKQSILAYLKAYGTTRRLELLSMLRAGGYDITERQLRRTLKEITAEGTPIGMSNSGYFIAETDEQHAAVKEYTKKKIFGLWRFYNDFDQAFCKLKPERQLTLFQEMAR